MTEPTKLPDDLLVWIDDYGNLHYQSGVKLQPYCQLRARLARRTLQDEFKAGGEPFGPTHVKVRAAAFERILGTNASGPESWRFAIDRLRRAKEVLFLAQRMEQRRAKAWYTEQHVTAMAAD